PRQTTLQGGTRMRPRTMRLALVTTTALLLFTPMLTASPGASPLNLDAAGRTPSDKDRDAYNKPADLLEFWGVKDGMKVMDLFPGDGYLTLLLGQAVGPKGKAIGYASYDHDAFSKRMAKSPMPNVEEVPMSEEDGFGPKLKEALAALPAGSFDAVLT